MASTQEVVASTQEVVAEELYRCYHCGLESTGHAFKYFDNKKVDQPRFQCQHCDKLFTLGTHGRPQGKTYAKKRNEDLAELKSLSRQCRYCGVADNAPFKYYNNYNPSQPRFKCLSCGENFQMRLLGTGEGRHLVHTNSQKKRAPYRRKKQGVPSDLVMPLVPHVSLLPEMGDEDVQYSNFLEAELAEEENYEANFNSWTGYGDSLEPPPCSGEEAHYSDFTEASKANVADALPPTWSDEDAEMMEFFMPGATHNEAPYIDMGSDNMDETVSESTSENAEVMYGTLASQSPVVSGSEPWPWTHNDASGDPYSMSYADAAAACCLQMDLDMAIESSKAE